jgi:hypothetical protein
MSRSMNYRLLALSWLGSAGTAWFNPTRNRLLHFPVLGLWRRVQRPPERRVPAAGDLIVRHEGIVLNHG